MRSKLAIFILGFAAGIGTLAAFKTIRERMEDDPERVTDKLAEHLEELESRIEDAVESVS